MPGRPRLLHQVRRGQAGTRAWARGRAGCGAGRAPPGAAAALTGAPLSRSDELRCTTWLHPRTGEPVNSGHMIRSGGSRAGGAGGSARGGARLGGSSLTRLFWRFRRPAPRLGGGLHGRGSQLLHRVSDPGAALAPVRRAPTSSRRAPPPSASRAGPGRVGAHSAAAAPLWGFVCRSCAAGSGRGAAGSASPRGARSPGHRGGGGRNLPPGPAVGRDSGAGVRGRTRLPAGVPGSSDPGCAPPGWAGVGRVELRVASGVWELGAGKWGVETEGISCGEDFGFRCLSLGWWWRVGAAPPWPSRARACGGRWGVGREPISQ